MSQLLFRERRVLWMDPRMPRTFVSGEDRHCCQAMRAALVNGCDQHAHEPFECPDMLVAYSDVFDEYGLIVHDGGASYLLISFCPFCGGTLPESRRDEWFDRLETLGFADPFAEDIPEAFKSGAWRRGAAN